MNKKAKGRLRKKERSLKAFARDLRSLDWKILFLFALVLSLLPFVSYRGFAIGSILGLKTSFFETPTLNPLPFAAPTPALYPLRISDMSPPSVSAESFIVLDVSSQVVLYQKNENVRFPPASTTKIMTALVAMEHFGADEVLSVPDGLLGDGAAMGLMPAEKISFENLLFGLLLVSGNDAAETIARNFKGGMEAFVASMNKKAQELSLKNTHFENPTGLFSENHYTSALDLARLSSFALRDEKFARIVATKYKVVLDVSGTKAHALENLNKLLGIVEGVTGIKTGFTQEAGQVLVASANRGGHTILTVVLKSEDRFSDSRALLEWAFANHEFTPATQP